MVKENVLKIIFNNLNIVVPMFLTSNNICLIFCCNLWWWSLSIGIIVSCSASQKTLQSVGGLKSNYITIYLTIFFFFLLLLLRWLIWVDLIIANTKMFCIKKKNWKKKINLKWLNQMLRGNCQNDKTEILQIWGMVFMTEHCVKLTWSLYADQWWTRVCVTRGWQSWTTPSPLSARHHS